MSPERNDPLARVLKGGKPPSVKVDPPTETISNEQPVEKPTPRVSEFKPTVIMSELDSYVHERMRAQPQTVEEATARVETLDTTKEYNRLSLPDFFEALSYDNPKKKGHLIFRWIMKDKRALDRAIDVLGWTLVNRVIFPDAPNRVFTANGGVERGDAILAFIPSDAALRIRKAPGDRSRDLLHQRMTQVDSDYVLMTGNPKDENVYQPKLGAEESETGRQPADREGSPTSFTEGRDF